MKKSVFRGFGEGQTDINRTLQPQKIARGLKFRM